ncbi:TPA: hypothetical protein HA246_06475 [Candidatus Woesearchaeota archaeon]|nr:hypothetical protein [Candidatus Woesearchaeota archaeon]
MVFSRFTWQSDDDPNTRPSIDDAVLGKGQGTSENRQAIDFAAEIGTDEWREIDTDGAVVDGLDDSYERIGIVDLVYDDVFRYQTRNIDYETRLTEWMRESWNILQEIERGEKLYPEFLVKKGIALASIGIDAAEVQASEFSTIGEIYARKRGALKRNLHDMIKHLNSKSQARYNSCIDELAEEDPGLKRDIPKTDLSYPFSGTYQRVIDSWVKKASDAAYNAKSPKRTAANLLKQGLKIIQHGKKIGYGDVVMKNIDKFYDMLESVKGVVTDDKYTHYEREFRKALG